MNIARELWLKENADKVREYKRRHANKAYAENPQKFKSAQARWRRENNEKARRRDAKYRAKYAAARRRQFSHWRKRNMEYFRVRKRADVVNLADWYVRMKLSQGTCIRPNQWPADLAELKRAQMKVKRLCRKSQTTTN